MPRYDTPGVYVEETPQLPPVVAPVATALPVFIGYTEKAEDGQGEDLYRKAVRIASLQDYEARFGGPPARDFAVAVEQRVDADGRTLGVAVDWAAGAPAPPVHGLHYGLQLYFANGGGDCFIHSLGPYGDVRREDFLAALAALESLDAPTLLVFSDAVNLGDADHAAVVNAALAGCRAHRNRFAIIDVPRAVPGETDDVARVDSRFRAGVDGRDLATLGFGAAYFPYLRTRLPFAWSPADVVLARFDTVAVDAAGNASSGPVPVPGAAGSRLGDAALDLERRAPEIVAAIRSFLDAAGVILPPAAAVAGVYCQVDRTRRVWKAPANVALAGVASAAVRVSPAQQDLLNVDATAGKSVNAIRDFPGKGTLVWGGRTLAGNDNEWRYVNVRRFVRFVEASVAQALEAFAFEPNHRNTWRRAQAMVESFLTGLWRQGALQGAKPEHAFYAGAGLGRTMTAADVAEGRMIVEMGLAAVRPAEFIVLRVCQAVEGAPDGP